MKTLKHFLVLVFISVFPFFISNCEKEHVSTEIEVDALKSAEFNDLVNIEDRIVVFGPEEYVREKGKPKVKAAEVEFEHYEHFEETYTIVIENGDENGNHRVSSADIKIDGEVVFSPKDFNGKTKQLTKEILLPEQFELGVEIRGAPESWFTISIKGELKPGRAKIGSEGGTVESIDKSAYLVIPEGALEASEIIVIENSQINLPNSNLDLSSTIQLYPEDIVLNKPVLLGFNLDYLDPEDNYPVIFQVYADHGWLEFYKTYHDEEHSQIYTYINHFSFWTHISHPSIASYTELKVHLENSPSNPANTYTDLFNLTKDDIMGAFSQWTQFTDVDIVYENNAPDSHIKVVFLSPLEAIRKYGLSRGNLIISPLGNGHGVALWNIINITKRVIIYNDDVEWRNNKYYAENYSELSSSNESNGVNSIEYIALHEIGHFMGLKDDWDSGISIMGGGLPKRPRALPCEDLGMFDKNLANECAVNLDLVGDSRIIVEPGDHLSNIFEVKVSNSDGIGVVGVPVFFYPNNASNTLFDDSFYSRTDNNGVASIPDLPMPEQESVIEFNAFAILSGGKMKQTSFTIEVQANLPSSNIAGACAISYSSISTSWYGGYRPNAAHTVDGTIEASYNHWSANDPPAWLSYQFDQQYIDHVKVYSGYAPIGTLQYSIDYLDQNDVWQTIAPSAWINEGADGVSLVPTSTFDVYQHEVHIGAEVKGIRINVSGSTYPETHLWRTVINEVEIFANSD